MFRKLNPVVRLPMFRKATKPSRKDYEGTSAEECRPLGRRLIALSNHVEKIQWPASLVQDLRDAALVLEIIAEEAETDDSEEKSHGIG